MKYREDLPRDVREMEHLWIEYQLVDDYGPFPLRFQKKLGGFDAERFRADFLAVCRKHGYYMDSYIGWE